MAARVTYMTFRVK